MRYRKFGKLGWDAALKLGVLRGSTSAVRPL